MAQFYATIRGARGPTSRLGHKGSGIRTHTMSYEGVIEVEMRWNEKLQCDEAVVTLRYHPNSSQSGVIRTLFDGPLDPAKAVINELAA